MTHIPTALLRLVRQRAGNCCEYCLLHEDDAFFPYEVDHIIAEKHGGQTTADNLCLSCLECNRHKGSDIASLDPETARVVALFHPRRGPWDRHFRLDGPRIEPLTAEGRVTVRPLRLNDPARLLERERLLALGRYPGRRDAPAPKQQPTSL